MFDWRNIGTTGSAARNSFLFDDDDDDETQGAGSNSSSSSDLEVVPGRTWFDRVLAPFEAPQQTLFSFTKNVAEDGLQFSDALNAISHGAKYFNPWSEQARITEEEISEIFFGEDRFQNKFIDGAVNLGIGLLYDPLWVSTGARAVGIGGRAAQAIDRAVNPAMAAMDTVSAVGRASLAATNAAGRAILGGTRWDTFSAQLARTFISPSKRIDPELYEELGRFQVGLQEMQMQVGAVVKRTRNAGREASDILTDALESHAFYDYQMAGVRTKKSAASFDEIMGKLEENGIDSDLFLDSYQRLVGINDQITRMGLKTGRFSASEVAEYSGGHLRRLYNFRQPPVDALRRLDQLEKRTKGVRGYGHLYKSYKLFDGERLRGSLMELADELADVRPALKGSARSAGADFQEAVIDRSIRQHRYFPNNVGEGAGRRFDVDSFLEDFGEYVNSNPRHSIDEALEYVHETMFKGIELPSSVNEVLANYMTKGMVQTTTMDQVRNALQTARFGGGAEFRRYRENFDVLAQREAIPDEIATEVLGRIDTALPRAVDQVNQAGREVLISQLFDDLSGAIRLDPEAVDVVRSTISRGINQGARNSRVNTSVAGTTDPADLRKALQDTPDAKRAREEAVQALLDRYPDLTPEEALKYVNQIDSGTASSGSILKRTGGGIVSETEVKGWIRINPDSSQFGSLAGMYVSPSTFTELNQYAHIMGMADGSTSRGMFHAVGDWIEGMTQKYKFLKIIADPAAHFRDTVGSIIQMDMMGMTPFKASSWKKSMDIVGKAMDGEIDPTLELAHSVGYNLLGSTMSGAELGRAASRATDTMNMPALDWVDTSKNVFNKIGDFVRQSGNKAADWYQHRESVMRTYVFTNKYDELAKGITKAGKELTTEVQQNLARQAAEFTNRTLFNYADVPLAVEFARRYGIAPFLTFPMKATGQMADVLYNRPWNILKYDRTIDTWNSSWAGGDEEFAREIQRLPQHMRQNMVVRLPWENREGNPLYLDVSYFLPWAAVRDLSGDAMGPIAALQDGASRNPDLGDMQAAETVQRSFPGASGGGGIFSPPLVQLIKIFQGEDGLGRPIFNEHDSPEQKAQAIGRAVWQFISPPVAPGGATADSVGRAISAAAQTSEEPADWVERLGLGMRTFLMDEDTLNRYGEGPTGRALPTLTENPAGQAGLGLASLFLPVSEADGARQVRGAAASTQAFVSDIQMQIRTISQNPNLSPEEKARRISRLRDYIQNNVEAFHDYRSVAGN